jgi:hypothetical protein
MKAGLTGAKPRLTIIPRAALNHLTRGLEYGADKYRRGNYHGAPPAALGGDAAALRLLGYLDAAQRHISRVTDAMNRALGTGGDLAAAVLTVDDDATAKFPASMLPDLSHALASLALGITCAADDGLLPLDPGRPWDVAIGSTADAALGQKADPAAERARVDALRLVIDRATAQEIVAGIDPERELTSREGAALHDRLRECFPSNGVPVSFDQPASAPVVTDDAQLCACGDSTPEGDHARSAYCTSEHERAARERDDVPAKPHEPQPASDACVRGLPLGDQPWCATHDVALDRMPRSDVQRCRLTQREVP